MTGFVSTPPLERSCYCVNDGGEEISPWFYDMAQKRAPRPARVPGPAATPEYQRNPLKGYGGGLGGANAAGSFDDQWQGVIVNTRANGQEKTNL